MLSPRALLRRLGDRFDLLAQHQSGRPSRHETLDAAIGWSYGLLPARLKRTFARFAVFAGPVGLERAEQVCADDEGHDVLEDLTTLVDDSLLSTVDRDREPAFMMLRTVRAFAHDRLVETGELDVVAQRHALALLALARDVEPSLVGDDARHQLDRLQAEVDDLRAALRHAVDRRDVTVALALLAALWRFWQMRGHLAEGRDVATRVLGLPGAEEEPEAYARGLEAVGGMAYWQGDMKGAGTWYERAVAFCRRRCGQLLLANALYNLSFTYSVSRIDPAAARRYAEESLQIYRRLQDTAGAARTLHALGAAAYFQDDYAAARDAYAECLELIAGTGDGFHESWAAYMLGLAEEGLGNPGQAEPLYRRACRGFSVMGDASGTVISLNALAGVARTRGDLARAARLAGAAEQLEKSSGVTMATLALEQERRGSLRNLRERLPEEWVAGAALEPADAVALALGSGLEHAPPEPPFSSGGSPATGSRSH